MVSVFLLRGETFHLENGSTSIISESKKYDICHSIAQITTTPSAGELFHLLDVYFHAWHILKLYNLEIVGFMLAEGDYVFI